MDKMLKNRMYPRKLCEMHKKIILKLDKRLMDKMKIIFYNKANEQRPAAQGAAP